MGSISYPNPSTADYFKPLEFVQVYFPYQFLFNLILVLSHGISSVLLLFIVIHNIIENALTNKDYFWKRLNKLPDYFLFRKTKVNYTDAWNSFNFYIFHILNYLVVFKVVALIQN